MLFYKVDAKYEYDYDKETQEAASGVRRSDSRERKVYELFEDSCAESLKKTETGEKSLIFLCGVKPKKITFGAIYSKPSEVKPDVFDYVKTVPIKISDLVVTEVTGEDIFRLVNNACRNDVLPDCDEVFETLGIAYFSDHRNWNPNRIRASEFMLEEIRSEKELEQAACRMLAKNSLLPELERIFAKTSVAGKGHPVHYIIRESDKDCRREIRLILQEALYKAGRIQNRRYAIAEVFSDSEISRDSVENLYRQNEGGMVIIRYRDLDDGEGGYRRAGGENVVMLCETAIKFRRNVLTVFSFQTECERLKKQFFDNLGYMTFVELYSDVVFGEEARSYLKDKSKEASIKADKKLYACVRENEGMHIRDLNVAFDRWYDAKVKTVIFPQYRYTESIKERVRNESVKGSAMEELENMIGLSEAKTVIKKALDYFKLQKLYSDMGIVNDRPAMHMVFTGNPGTAKTTVARLFARIMKENELLSVGDIYEVGRSDLVGKYVGHTAPLVKTKFKAAKGSVLFIDEAYSLVDEREGLYGDEAINTIVQEMENNRDNMVVIFAGYPDKMEQFLERNPGLRSRIGFHVHFDDYDADELCQIAELIASSKGNRIADAAKEKMRKAFEAARSQPDFGNGRYVRNLIEQAKMEQASRIIAFDARKVTKEMLLTIEAEDIVVPKSSTRNVGTIGFAV